MKKLLIIAMLLMALVTTVSAISWWPPCPNTCQIWNYIENNEEDWGQSSVTEEYYTSNSYSGGLSRADLGRELMNDIVFFYEYDGSFMDYLDSVYGERLDKLESKTLDLESRVYSLQKRAYVCEQQLALLLNQTEE